MRTLVQRVTSGKVEVDGKVTGSVEKGMVVLVGVTHTDTEADAKYLAEKCVNLRIFHDDEGKMNRSLLDVDGEVLIISQFTLYGDCRKGRRPGFSDAALPAEAERLYELFKELVKKQNVKKVACGRFGADMMVKIFNDGPVTFMLEAKNGVGV